MFFKHIYEKGLAQASYIVGCQATGEALVIDPRRDIQIYIDIAEQEKLKITHVTETHIHADFLSGAKELAALTNAKLLLSDEGNTEWKYQFDHIGLKEGDSFMVGNLKIDVLHTPGHTPEHISFLLTDTPASNKPVMIFTGDFVFVGDVGRPDLLEKAAGYRGTQEIGAKQMFESLKKFKSLPDFVQVWPGHGAGSACGKALGAVPSSTVGYEKISNWALQIDDETKFVEALLEGQPEPPIYFAMMKKLNKTGPAILGGIPTPAHLSLSQLELAILNNIKVIDTRNKLAFAGGHIPGSINIQDNSAFTTWAGWLLSYDEPFILIASKERIEALTLSLIRIGLDNIFGYFSDLELYASAGHNLETVNQINVYEFEKIKDEENIHIVDVRGYTEYNLEHIPGAENLHAGYIKDKLQFFSKNKQIVLYCAGGDRSSIALSILKAGGFSNVVNLSGGINAYKNENLPVESNMTIEV